MNKTKIFLSLVLALLFNTLVAVKASNKSENITEKSIKYNISALGMNLGQFTVKQKSNNGIISIEGITDIKVKLLLTYQVKYIQETTHQNGRLRQSHLQTKKNGETYSDTWLIAQKDDYLLIKDGDSTLINDDITYTGSLLYFNEPIHSSYLYKEKSGEKRRIKSTDDHTYVLLNDKGQVTHEYTYKNGILAQAKIKFSIADIRLDFIQ
ncbi:hypothetical protein SAMN06265379_101660 [Saccharicrinis carchari]|uniref:Uncharacterized protein n=1 Tax=Saccharicrinis carchari TaxID=1168039 RepID=A0A521B3H6_SACCC|nr:DUF6134 family protein [Saccharicrinis carchari]SMO41609.1 hypothetical protein SAMN06265379_101660 [Saccharicrinis carchari]